MYVDNLLRKKGLKLHKKYFEFLLIPSKFVIVRVFIVINLNSYKILDNRKSVVNRTVKISLILLFVRTDFPEYSQNQMPDNQIVLHSQSLIRKLQSKIE